jgi:hypothetical protein
MPKAFRKTEVGRLKGCDNVLALSRELGVPQRLLYKWRDRLEPIDDGEIVVLGNWVSADLERMSVEADARLRGSSMLIAEPGRQNRARPCGLERWGGETKDRRPLLI